MDDAAITVSTLSPDEGQRWEERETCYDEGVAVDIVKVIGARAPRGTALMARRGEGVADVLWLGVADGSQAVTTPFVPAVPNDDTGAVGWLGRWEGATPELMVQTLERTDMRLTVRACLAVVALCVNPRVDVEAADLLREIEAAMDRRKGVKLRNMGALIRVVESRMANLPSESRKYQAAWSALAAANILSVSGADWATVCVRAASGALRRGGTKKPLPQIAAAIREVVPLGVAMVSALDE